jgi:hypothetical protein
MRPDEIADMLGKWLEEESVLSCTGSLDEFTFDMNCRVSVLTKESFTLTSEHGDCSLTFRLDVFDTAFSYAEPRSISSARGLSLTPEQDQSSTIIALLHPESSPKDSSKPRDKLQLMELSGWS